MTVPFSVRRPLRLQRVPMRARQRAFTLVELIVAITVSSIVVGFIALFIVTPVNSYFAQTRRAELGDSADRAMRSMATDVRFALPESVRVGLNGPSIAVLELLLTVDVARYRKAPSSTGDANRDLTIGAVDQDFSTLGVFSRLPHPFDSTRHYLVIGHGTLPANNAYALTRVITPVGTPIHIDSDTTMGVHDEDHIRLTNPFNFRADSPTGSVFLVQGPVAYLCNTTAHTLTRYWGYTIASSITARNSAAKLNAAGASSALVARDVATCAMDPRPGKDGHGGLVSVRITLSRSGESLQVFQQIPVESLP
jgi:MSHA biogenesis protein MshO